MYVLKSCDKCEWMAAEKGTQTKMPSSAEISQNCTNGAWNTHKASEKISLCKGPKPKK